MISTTEARQKHKTKMKLKALSLTRACSSNRTAFKQLFQTFHFNIEFVNTSHIKATSKNTYLYHACSFVKSIDGIFNSNKQHSSSHPINLHHSLYSESCQWSTNNHSYFKLKFCQFKNYIKVKKNYFHPVFAEKIFNTQVYIILLHTVSSGPRVSHNMIFAADRASMICTLDPILYDLLRKAEKSACNSLKKNNSLHFIIL